MLRRKEATCSLDLAGRVQSPIWSIRNKLGVVMYQNPLHDLVDIGNRQDHIFSNHNLDGGPQSRGLQ